MVSIWADLEALEREHHLDQLHEPDLGFAWAAYRWAEGDELDDILDATDLAAGDFVRWVKQLLDLADQVADASAGSRRSRKIARETSSACAAGSSPTPGSASDPVLSPRVARSTVSCRVTSWPSGSFRAAGAPRW